MKKKYKNRSNYKTENTSYTCINIKVNEQNILIILNVDTVTHIIPIVRYKNCEWTQQTR
jgi:hypothetical protein